MNTPPKTVIDDPSSSTTRPGPMMEQTRIAHCCPCSTSTATQASRTAR